MKIENVTLKNFGGIKDISVTPKKVNVLIGPNGAGKSSFLKGLKYSLIGSTDRSNVIRDGSSMAKVKIALDSYIIEKTVGTSKTLVQLNGKTTTQKSISELLSDEYGASKNSVKFLTSSEVFEGLSGSEFTEFMLNSGFIPVDIDINDFIRIAKTKEAISTEMEDELRKFFPPAPEQFSLNTIEDVNKDVSNLIKGTKKEISRLESIISSIPAIDETKLRSISEIRKDLEVVIGEDAKIKAYSDTAKKAADMKAKIEALKAKYAADPTVRPNPAAKSTAEKLMVQLKSEIEKTITLVSKLEKTNELLSNQIKRLDTNKCPLSDRLECKQDKSAVKAELSEDIEDNNIQIDILKMDLEGYRDQYDKAAKSLEEYRSQEIAWNNKINLAKQIKSLSESVPKIPEPPKTTGGDIETKKRRLNEELQFVSKIENIKTEKKRLAAENEKLEVFKEVERLTSKKGGVKAEILKVLLGTLVTSINDMAKEICPHISMELEVSGNGNVLIKCKTPSGTQEYNELSTGEKLMVQFLIMAQINKLSGFKLLVLDNLDKLDKKNFESMIDFLLSPKTDMFDHIFVATVDHKDFIDVLTSKPDVNVVSV